MFQITASSALWFLPFAVPIAFWVAWNDMAHMKIPNQAVLALMAVFAIIGLIALPFETYAWRWLHLIVVLVIGFGVNVLGMVGAGDAKFAAAMAPLIALGDAMTVLQIFAAVLISAFIAHRLMRLFPPFRNAVPHWASWKRGDFPMGLALGPTLVLYLIMGAVYGA